MNWKFNLNEDPHNYECLRKPNVNLKLRLHLMHYVVGESLREKYNVDLYSEMIINWPLTRHELHHPLLKHSRLEMWYCPSLDKCSIFMQFLSDKDRFGPGFLLHQYGTQKQMMVLLWKRTFLYKSISANKFTKNTIPSMIFLLLHLDRGQC